MSKSDFSTRHPGNRRPAPRTDGAKEKTPGRAIGAMPGQRGVKQGDIVDVFTVGALMRAADADECHCAVTLVGGGFRVDSIEWLSSPNK